MDLTTLDRCKAYIGQSVSSGNADALISQLITRASGQIAKFCTVRFDHQRKVLEPMDGTGCDRLFLPHAPNINVFGLKIGATTIPASPDGIQAGYQFDTNTLYLFGGYVFTMGHRNVFVSYEASFTATETDVIPAAAGNATTVTLSPTTADDSDGSGFPFADLGVTFSATGLPLTPVASAPVAGQYVFAGGTYTFAAADAGKIVTMSYDYIPGSVEQACIELVAMKLKQRDNIGINSRSLANESISYTDRDMSKSVQGLLAPYNRRIPA